MITLIGLAVLSTHKGGKIYIGKDDVGNVVGVADYKDLMEKIPNKIKNQLGITT